MAPVCPSNFVLTCVFSCVQESCVPRCLAGLCVFSCPSTSMCSVPVLPLGSCTLVTRDFSTSQSAPYLHCLLFLWWLLLLLIKLSFVYIFCLACLCSRVQTKLRPNRIIWPIWTPQRLKDLNKHYLPKEFALDNKHYGRRWTPCINSPLV